MFEIKPCYYGARERLFTHINEMKSLAEQLKTTPYNIKTYFSQRLDTDIQLEGNTLKVKGLIRTSLINTLLEEFLVDNTH
jgi:translation initiation factor 2 beta subunit (eIF-2beta)/eIF-5